MLSEMKRIKITMLGLSGSGKTAFISGLYHSMIGSIAKNKDVLLSLIGLENDGNVHATTGLSTKKLMETYKIKDVMSSSGTFKTTDFNFNCRIIKDSQEKNIPLYLFDYKGGLLVDLENESEILLNQIKDSDVILILLDAIVLANNAKDIMECKEKTGALYINMLINSLTTIMPQKGVTVLTVLTKTDSSIIPQEYKENGFEKLCKLAKEVLDGVYSLSSYLDKTRNWNFGMIPVTAIGEGNSRTQQYGDEFKCEIKEGAVVEQKNIDVALIYSLFNALNKRVNEYEEEISICNATIDNSKKLGFDKRARRKASNEAADMLAERVVWKEDCQRAKDIIGEAFSEIFNVEVK